MRVFVRVIICILFVSELAFAAAGTEGAAFLNIPIGGAPSAMGSAYSALATDAYAPVINPGGLGFLDSTQLAGHHVSYLETSHYDFASLVYPLSSKHSLGASVQYLGSGDLAGRDISGNPTGDFSAHYSGFSLAYGNAITEAVSLGLTSRWINAKIDDVSANAYAADVGALWKAAKRLNLGLVVSNAGSKLKFLDEGDSLPLAVRWGGAYFPTTRWTLSADGIYQVSGLVSGHFGAQWQALPIIALRAGYRTDVIKELSATAGFSAGIGLSLWGSEFSYTWLPYEDLGQTHSFALLLRFGESKKRNVIQHEARNWKTDQEAPFESDLEELLAQTASAGDRR